MIFKVTTYLPLRQLYNNGSMLSMLQIINYFSYHETFHLACQPM